MVSKNEDLTITEQCELLEVNRQTHYYKPADRTAKLNEDEYIMQRIDYWHYKHCVFGYRKILRQLRREDGLEIGKKRVIRLMHEMNIQAVYPKPNLSKSDKKALKLPYLLKNLNIDHSNQVWAIDITYIKLGRSHMYLTAIIDWYTRYIVGYELSDTLETAPVLKAVGDAIGKYGNPEIINSDQGSQFTSDEYKTFLKDNGVKQSMDGKARWVDNVRIERWFRSLKCELIYINDFNTPRELRQAIGEYVHFYNYERPHESLEYKYPSDIFINAA